MSHREEMMMNLVNSKFRVKGEKNRGQVLAKNEVDKSLEKEAQLQQKIEDMDSFTFKLTEIRSSHKHAKHFKQLAHRRLKRPKEILKRSNELDELNRELNKLVL